MRYLYYLIIIIVGLLIVFSALTIAGPDNTIAFETACLYMLVLFTIIYTFTTYLLRKYQTIAYYNVMAKIFPKSASIFSNRAVGYLRRADYETALQILQTSIQLNPKRGITYVNRGAAYLGTKRYEQALQDFNYAQSLIPKNAIVYMDRGILYGTTRHYQDALQDFDRVLKSRSRALFADAYMGKAEVYAHLKDYQQALQECEHAIAAAPRKGLSYIARGLIYESFDHFQEARQDYEHLIKISSPSAKMLIQYDTIVLTKCHVAGHINYAAASLKLKEYQVAMEHLEQAIALDPQCAHSYYVRGFAYLWLNDLEQARTNIERCWQMNALGCSYGLVLAWLDLCELKPDQDIKERLEAIGTLDKMDYFARVSQGIAQWIQGKHEEALATLQQHIDTELDTTFAYFWSGMVCASLGRDDEAITMIQRSLKEHLPPALLAPLRWLEEVNPSFYQSYALSLLSGNTNTNIVEP